MVAVIVVVVAVVVVVWEGGGSVRPVHHRRVFGSHRSDQSHGRQRLVAPTPLPHSRINCPVPHPRVVVP